MLPPNCSSSLSMSSFSRLILFGLNILAHLYVTVGAMVAAFEFCPNTFSMKKIVLYFDIDKINLVSFTSYTLKNSLADKSYDTSRISKSSILLDPGHTGSFCSRRPVSKEDYGLSSPSPAHSSAPSPSSDLWSGH